MKHLLIISLITLTIFGFHNDIASARHINAYHIGNYRINPKRPGLKRARRRKFKNAVFIMSIQLGASEKSLHNLSHDLGHMSHKKLVLLYHNTQREYTKVNHHRFDTAYYSYN